MFRALYGRFSQAIHCMQIYRNAASCYEAIASLLDSDGRQYLLGSQASSIDAFLYGHLCLHLRAPTSSPELRNAVHLRTILYCHSSNLLDCWSAPLNVELNSPNFHLQIVCCLTIKLTSFRLFFLFAFDKLISKAQIFFISILANMPRHI